MPSNTWAKRSGEVYGAGPGLSALADVKMVNAMAEVNLRAAQLGIAPPLIYADNAKLVRGFIPGSALKIARPFGDHEYFRSARAALRVLHRAPLRLRLRRHLLATWPHAKHRPPPGLRLTTLCP